jgi:hypothetical protein
MATNAKIKKALLDKLGVTPRRLSQLAKARKQQLPMSTEHAVYTIAFENGIDVAKELGPETTTEVQRLVSLMRSSGSSNASSSANNVTSKARAGGSKVVKVSIAGVDVGKIPALNPSHATEAQMMAERVYPLVYIFENSVRDLIERVLKAQFGSDWWEKGVTKDPKETAKKHLEAEKKDPWHSKRGRRPIDYVFLNELWAIIKHQWKLFSPLFPDQPWIQTLITRDMNVSRIVLAHMNPLGDDDVKAIEASFRKWVRQLEAVESLIP